MIEQLIKRGFTPTEATIYSKTYQTALGRNPNEEEASRVAHAAVQRYQISQASSKTTRGASLPQTEAAPDGSYTSHEEVAEPLASHEYEGGEEQEPGEENPGYTRMQGLLPFGKYEISNFRAYHGFSFYEIGVRGHGELGDKTYGLVTVHNPSESVSAHKYADTCAYPVMVVDGNHTTMHLGK